MKDCLIKKVNCLTANPEGKSTKEKMAALSAYREDQYEKLIEADPAVFSLQFALLIDNLPGRICNPAIAFQLLF